MSGLGFITLLLLGISVFVPSIVEWLIFGGLANRR
jgi:hypothetical protein